MKILLDTHIYLWWLENDIKLKKRADGMIKDAEVVYVSMVSTWETAIKTKLGKFKVNVPKIMDEITANGFRELSLKNEHILQLAHLPLHHRDPFDRILIAQAISEPLQFLTADRSLARYSELVTVV